MSSHIRQRFPPFQFECRVTDDSAFCCSRSNAESLGSAFCCSRSNVESLDSAFCYSRSNVESYSIAFSALRGRMSRHIRQRLLTFQVECRIKFDIALRPSMTFDRAFRPSTLNVESHSTACSAIPGRMSSHTRHRFPLFKVEFRVILGSIFPCSRSNVDSHPTALSAEPGRMSSHSRQRFPPFQFECRVTHDWFTTFSSNVEIYSTALSIPGRI